MIYLLILYKDNGKVEVREYYTRNAMRVWLRENMERYITYDVYMAKCINEIILDKILKV